MIFDYRQILKDNNECLLFRLNDFLVSEIDELNYKYISEMISWPNFRSFTYEGNQYAIIKREGVHKLLIVDEVSLEHGVAESQVQFEIEVLDLLELIKERTKDW